MLLTLTGIRTSSLHEATLPAASKMGLWEIRTETAHLVTVGEFRSLLYWNGVTVGGWFSCGAAVVFSVVMSLVSHIGGSSCAIAH